MQRKISRAAAVLTIGVCVFATAGAATKAEDAIKYRQAIMESLAGHMTALTMIAMRKVDASQYLQNHTDAIAGLGNEMDVLFPAGSGGDDTEALDKIWDDSDKFAAAVAKMQKSSAALKEAANSGEKKAIISALAATGKSCKGCHEDFRAEDDDSDSDD